MNWNKCELCERKAFIRCEEHNRCDYCGLTKRESIENKISLVHCEGGLFCDDCWKKKINKKIKEFNEDTDYTDEITCPYCGLKFGDSSEYNDDDGEEIVCADCNNKFILNVDFEINYSTTKLSKEIKGEKG